MTIQEQKIILRLLSPEQIAEMFPAAKETADWIQSPHRASLFPSLACGRSNGWWCTRLKDHDGPHVRHRSNGKLPIVWLNDNTDNEGVEN